MHLTPEERRQIYEEEKVRVETETYRRAGMAARLLNQPSGMTVAQRVHGSLATTVACLVVAGGAIAASAFGFPVICLLTAVVMVLVAVRAAVVTHVVGPCPYCGEQADIRNERDPKCPACRLPIRVERFDGTVFFHRIFH